MTKQEYDIQIIDMQIRFKDSLETSGWVKTNETFYSKEILPGTNITCTMYYKNPMVTFENDNESNISYSIIQMDIKQMILDMKRIKFI